MITNKGKKLISDLKFYESYSKYREDLGRKETWEESVEDVLQMHRNKFRGNKEVLNLIDEVEEDYKGKLILASQRNLQYREQQILQHNARLFNCFGVETSFITKEGVKTFNDFNDGDETLVLTHKGNWKKAVVKNYGEQSLNKISINRGNAKYTYRATNNHRWLLKDGTDTTNLKIGDSLLRSNQTFLQFDYDFATIEEKLYWCYGLVYGDGTRIATQEKGVYTHSMIRLCDHDREYYSRFEELGFKTSKPLSIKGDIMVYTGTYLKTTPDPIIDSPELIRAFVAGYLAADGAKTNKTTISKYKSIQASDEDHINFIKKCFPIAGVYIVSEEDLTGQVTNYGTRPHTIRFIITQGQGNLSPHFTVKDIIEDVAIEQVWCLEVEDDRSFTFPNGLHTGNCASTYIDRAEVFKQIMYTLLCGCGMGYSVERRFIDQLPSIQKRSEETITHIVEDSIEGWALALDSLMMSFFNGSSQVRFDGSLVRPEGAMIAGQFKAPGYEPLKKSLEIIEKMLQSKINNEDFKLTSLDCHDIICISSDAVLSAGVRRSALIALFDKDDELMLKCKTGDWFYSSPWRARSNNSIKLLKGAFTKEEFEYYKQSIKEFGEPGIVLVDDMRFTTNPCAEIGFIPINPTTGKSCISFCNLNEISGFAAKDEKTFYRACKTAAVLGTLQASYTNFAFLGQDTIDLVEWEALIGVSITGIMDNPDIILNKETLKRGAEIVKEVNSMVASLIGINTAARCTTIKPSGNSAVILGTSSGIHPAHSRQYFRIMQINKNNEIGKLLAETNECLLEDSVWSAAGRDFAAFIPVEEPKSALVKDDLTDLQFLEIVDNVYNNWVIPGTNMHLGYSEFITHNVSNTITVQDWDRCFDYIFEHQDAFCGLSFMPSLGDKVYKQAPFTKVMSFEELSSTYKEASIFASGLIVDSLHAFDNDLWDACEAVVNINFPLTGDRYKVLLKKDIVRRLKKFAKNYFKNDLEKAITCLKDVHLYHKWVNINRNFKKIDFTEVNLKPTFTNVGEMGAVACNGPGGSCEIVRL